MRLDSLAVGTGHSRRFWAAQSKAIIAFHCMMDAQLRQAAANRDQREALREVFGATS